MWLLKYSAFPLHFPVSCVSYARTAAWVFTEPETRIWVLVIYLQGSGKVGIEIGTWYWAPKITADGDCSHETKRRLLLGRKVMTNLDSILKSRDITLPTKVRLVKAVLFLVVMYGCES